MIIRTYFLTTSSLTIFSNSTFFKDIFCNAFFKNIFNNVFFKIISNHPLFKKYFQ